MVRGNDDGSEPRVIDGDGPGRRAVQAVKSQAISPNRRPPLDHNQRPARDRWYGRQSLVRGGRVIDADGVEDGIAHVIASLRRTPAQNHLANRFDVVSLLSQFAYLIADQDSALIDVGPCSQ